MIVKSLPYWTLQHPVQKNPLICPDEASPHPDVDLLSWGSSRNKDHFKSFEHASKMAEVYGTRICVLIQDLDDLICIDLDIKDDSTPEHITMCREIVETYKDLTYIEQSAGGKGFHIWIKGDLDRDLLGKGIEVYQHGPRTMGFTGSQIGSGIVGDAPDLLNRLVSLLDPLAPMFDVNMKLENTGDVTKIPFHLEKILASDKMRALFNGDISGYPTASEADMGLMRMIWLMCGKMVVPTREIFKMSALGQRQKNLKKPYLIERMLCKMQGEHLQAVKEVEGRLGDLESVTIKGTKGKVPVNKPFELVNPHHPIGQLAQWIYASSPKPVLEIAYVAAVGIYGGLLGRQIQFRGSGCNPYIILSAPSGSGKDMISKASIRVASEMSKLFHNKISDWCIEGEQASVPGFRNILAETPCILNVFKEFHDTLKNSVKIYGRENYVDFLKKIFDSSSKGSVLEAPRHKDKLNDAKPIQAPAVTMIAESTHSVLTDIDDSMITDGFLSRCLVLAIDPPIQLVQKEFYKVFETVPHNIVNHLGECAKIKINENQFIECQITTEADEMIDEVEKEANRLHKENMDERARALYVRYMAKVSRYAALFAASRNPNHPVIEKCDVKEADYFVGICTNALIYRMGSGEVGRSDPNAQRGAMWEIIRRLLSGEMHRANYPEDLRKQFVIPKAMLQTACQANKAFRGERDRFSFKDVLNSMVEFGVIEEVSSKEAKSFTDHGGIMIRVLKKFDY